ncbi:MAG TPA: RsmG family class I SAM-dependent methyltransferase [Kofleriaceae bacterium]
MTELGETLAALGLPATRLAALTDYAGLFQKWNQRINLSAARSARDLEDHIIDCLHLVPHLRAASARPPTIPEWLDVGAGGGLPAAIVAICFPEAHIVALEPVHKKHAFLRAVARELGLPNLDPRAERLEDHARHDYAAAMSRATLDLRDWLTLGLGRVVAGGFVFGFEAVPRSDLPAGTQRYPYSHGAKSRAIVALQRPA